ncbi:Mitochondrial import receptor subunit TOM9-2 [Morella rubra]|uniref:Mitochondrial import receptor subunit TOM9-2 n=1 Tax=Morella rubra TaxID=262757 RepID=A0A6A1W2B4_9ROSI|nr:Mitochondrial import receptor subunit TOM9-2 [Morella rubra]
MASQGKKRVSATSNEQSIISRVSRSVSQSPILHQTQRVASDAAFVSKKLLRSTGRAAWIAGTTFLILVVPLIIEMDREQQFSDLELQQASLLGTAK